MKSSALSVLLVRYRMIGVPALVDWRHTSRTKFGCWWAPNSRLKMSMQCLPHDGVAALALSAPTVPSPPTTVSAAVAARILLLMDIPVLLLGPAAVPRAPQLSRPDQGRDG
ncbi:MAG: hypothetical protein ACRDPF_05935 [Streptosporangiaceae bacterium]